MRKLLLAAPRTALLSQAPDASLLGLYPSDDADLLGSDASGNGDHAASLGADHTAAGRLDGRASSAGLQRMEAPVYAGAAVRPKLTCGTSAKPAGGGGASQAVLTGTSGEYDRQLLVYGRCGSADWSLRSGEVAEVEVVEHAPDARP